MLRSPTLRGLLLIAAAAITGLALASPALAVHARPLGATPKYDQFVMAYMPCPGPGPGPSTHVAGPYPLPSCAPAPSSPWLTMGTPDSNGTAATFVGSSRLAVCPVAGCPAPDIAVTVSLAGVRCTGALAGTTPAVCPGGGLGSYTGSVAVDYPLRITDHCNTPGGVPPPACGGAGMPPNTATMMDIVFPVVVGCAPGAPPTPPGPGSTCGPLSTTFNTLVPGSVPVPAGPRRMNVQVGIVTVEDGGPDGDATTVAAAPNSLYLQQGVWVP